MVGRIDRPSSLGDVMVARCSPGDATRSAFVGGVILLVMWVCVLFQGRTSSWVIESITEEGVIESITGEVSSGFASAASTTGGKVANLAETMTKLKKEKETATTVGAAGSGGASTSGAASIASTTGSGGASTSGAPSAASTTEGGGVSVSRSTSSAFTTVSANPFLEKWVQYVKQLEVVNEALPAVDGVFESYLRSATELPGKQSKLLRDRSGGRVVTDLFFTDQAIYFSALRDPANYSLQWSWAYRGQCGNFGSTANFELYREGLGISGLSHIGDAASLNGTCVGKATVGKGKNPYREDPNILTHPNGAAVFSLAFQYGLARQSSEWVTKTHGGASSRYAVVIHFRAGDVRRGASKVRFGAGDHFKMMSNTSVGSFRFLPIGYHISVFSKLQLNIRRPCVIFAEDLTEPEETYLRESQASICTVKVFAPILEVWRAVTQAQVVILSVGSFALPPSMASCAIILYPPVPSYYMPVRWSRAFLRPKWVDSRNASAITVGHINDLRTACRSF